MTIVRPGALRLATAVGLVLGLVLDGLLGDPRRLHPVAGFGATAGRLERAVWADSRLRGVGYALGCTVPIVLAGALGERLTRRPVPRMLAVAAATWTVLGGRSLRREGQLQSQMLRCGDLAAARARLGHLAGRDADGLGEAELARAVVESVAENLSDALVAPLVWGALFGMPGLLGYRAVNTLDAMVGHKSLRHRRFGWFAARLDDAANLLPARLTAVLVAACSRRPARVWQVVRRDARQHPSPNAGWCESAFAGALGLRLGGMNSYHGRLERRPDIGDGRPAALADIPAACRLAARVSIAAGAAAAALAGARP